MRSEIRESRSWLYVENESNLDFIAGFPCTNYRCNGTLQKTEHETQIAIICSGCEDIFYMLGEDR